MWPQWRSPSQLRQTRQRPHDRQVDGEYVINEKIFVTAGCAPAIVVGDIGQVTGRAAIKSFIVPREHPGHGRTARTQARHQGLRHRRDPFDDVRIPKEGLLGDPKYVDKGFAVETQ